MSISKVCVAVISNGLVLVTVQDGETCLPYFEDGTDGGAAVAVREFVQLLTAQTVEQDDVLHLFTVPGTVGCATALYVVDAGKDAVVTNTSGYWVEFQEARIIGDVARLFHDVWEVTGVAGVREWRARIFPKTA
jgi:hypothetical protein